MRVKLVLVSVWWCYTASSPTVRFSSIFLTLCACNLLFELEKNLCGEGRWWSHFFSPFICLLSFRMTLFMSKTRINQHGFLAGACISVHIPAFSKCSRWGDSPTLWAQSRFFPLLFASLKALHHILLCYCAFSLLSEIACMGELANPTQSTMSNSQLLITIGEIHEIWPFSFSPRFPFLCPCAYIRAKNAKPNLIQLSTHLQSQVQVQSEAGYLMRRMDGNLRGCTISLHPLRLGICMLLDELQLQYGHRWTSTTLTLFIAFACR